MAFDRAAGGRVTLALAPPLAVHVLTLVLWTGVYGPNIKDAARAGRGVSAIRGGKMSAAQVKRYVSAVPKSVVRDISTLGVLGVCCVLGFFRPRWALWGGYAAAVVTTALFFSFQPDQFFLFVLLMHPMLFWIVAYASGFWTVRWALRGIPH